VKKVNPRRVVSSWVTPIGLLILTTGVLALVAISPIALKQVARVPGMNWVLLSNVGQTYGAVSALLSALALGGVTVSLLYQSRDVRTASEQAARTFHFELLKMEMDDPVYMEIMAATAIPGNRPPDYDSLRRRQFIHMWVSYWEGRYKLREMTDSEVRYTASYELFNSAEGRRYWSEAREIKLNTYKGRPYRFVKIVDEEYGKAVAKGPPSVVSLKTNSRVIPSGRSEQMLSGRSIIFICAATGSAIIAGRLLGRQFFRRPG